MLPDEQAALSLEDYRRYGRQMIIDELGLPAQKKLLDASVIVVGAGGLGCPALQYLCAAGVGLLGVVDQDIVELSNLQRQVLHSEETVGISKVESAARALRRMNSKIRIETHTDMLSAANAQALLAPYDIVLDCTDNAPARYLLSDTCVSLGKPLVSGAAQRLEGQLCTYNLPLGSSFASSSSPPDTASFKQERGPCYRCLFPRPPAPEMAVGCDETGILGAVTGIIGTMQAVEAIKLITGLYDKIPVFHIYSALTFPPFRSFKLRARRRTCPACGVEGERLGEISELDYVAFCGGPRPDWVKKGLEIKDEAASGEGVRRRIRAKDLYDALSTTENNDLRRPVRILDVRSPVEFRICHLPNSINIPLSRLIASPSQYLHPAQKQNDIGDQAEAQSSSQSSFNPKFSKPPPSLNVLVCRLGNDSQIAANALRTSAAIDGGSDSGALSTLEIVDLVGGLRSWAEDVDPSFPVY